MLKSITLKFTDNASITLPTEGVTIFVGPNNSGKSLILREIETLAFTRFGGGREKAKTIESLEGDWPSPAKLDSWLDTFGSRNVHQPDQVRLWSRRPHGDPIATELSRTQLEAVARNVATDPANWAIAASYFLRWGLLRLDGRTRFELSGDRPGGDLTSEPQNALQFLFQDDVVRKALQDLIYDAFGRYLVIDPSNLGRFSLKLSDTLPEDERSLSTKALTYFRGASHVTGESDGVQAFIGILVAILSGDFHTILLDEPEAFLHPPLARKLGANVAAIAKSKDSVLLAATHSADFLMGCIQASSKVRVMRLGYRKGRSTGKLVNTEELRDFLRHPLMRSSNVASALFHDGVVVCESDNDRVFYGEIYQRLQETEESYPSILFLNAHNKQTVPEIVGPLRKFGIPTVGIVDIDVVKEGGKEWAKQLEAINVPEPSKRGLEAERKAVKDLFDASGKNMKRDGGAALLDKEGQKAADRLFDALEKDGLFVVRRGELEHWLPELGVSITKTSWTVEILEKMGSDPDKAGYVKPGKGDVWDFMRGVVAWVRNEDRNGM